MLRSWGGGGREGGREIKKGGEKGGKGQEERIESSRRGWIQGSNNVARILPLS